MHSEVRRRLVVEAEAALKQLSVRGHNAQHPLPRSVFQSPYTDLPHVQLSGELAGCTYGGLVSFPLAVSHHKLAASCRSKKAAHPVIAEICPSEALLR